MEINDSFQSRISLFVASVLTFGPEFYATRDWWKTKEREKKIHKQSTSRSMGFSWSKIFPTETRLFVVYVYDSINDSCLDSFNWNKCVVGGIHGFETSGNDGFWKLGRQNRGIAIIVRDFCKIKLGKFFFFFHFWFIISLYDSFQSSNDRYEDFGRVINFFKNKVKKVFCTRVRRTSTVWRIFSIYQKINIRHAGTFVFQCCGIERDNYDY